MKLLYTRYQRGMGIYIYALILAALLGSGCKKEGRIDYIDSNAPAPVQISGINVENRSGVAVLTYKIPSDPNFYYAKAVYEIRPNVYMEARASIYTDTLRLEGFGDTLAHDVKIYSVGKNEKALEPIVVQVKPLTPPVLLAFETIDMEAVFGGIQIGFKNPAMADIAIVVMRDSTNLNTWSPLATFHTAADSGKFSIRNLDSVSQKFAVYIRDRWNNKSDTLYKTLSPIFEQAIPKPWSVLVLPTDQTALAGTSYTLSRLWNGLATWASGPYASSNNNPLPQWFTLDLGKKVQMNRVVMHQVDNIGHLYTGGAPKTVEVWGSNNPAQNGSWVGWDSLGTFHSFKPSGLPLGQISTDDTQYASVQGENFEFDHILSSYRYIRWKTTKTYNTTGQVVMGEIDVYGKIVN